jgi:hypothetical protein
MMLFGEADTASHHFWMFADPRSPRFDPEGARAFGGALRDVYRRLDAALGVILAELPRDATVLVALRPRIRRRRHDGAAPEPLARRARLARVPRGPSRARRKARARRPARGAGASCRVACRRRWCAAAGGALARRLESWSRFGAIDMARTRAFSEELNYAPSIWLNVRGRDPDGQIAPGAEYDAVVQALTADLLAWRHPDTGAAVVAQVHRRDAIYDGPMVDAAPDLVLELALDGGYSYPCLPSTPAETRSIRRLTRREHVAGKGGGMNGSHRPEGLWVLTGPRVATTPASEAAIVDVAPSVLHLAGCRCRPGWTVVCCLGFRVRRRSTITYRSSRPIRPTRITRPSCAASARARLPE